MFSEDLDAGFSIIQQEYKELQHADKMLPKKAKKRAEPSTTNINVNNSDEDRILDRGEIINLPHIDLHGDVKILDEFQKQSSREVSGDKGEGSMKLQHQARHQVAIPKNYDYRPISEYVPNPKPAKTYPFVLDPFQQMSIYCIEKNESVLVSAHTSAGKTVVAEYSIAQSLRNKQRVIYTSPIKALSNQKYREFYEQFQDVGLLTGDVTINPNSSCLVMTTEILRAMLYQGHEVLREVAWVIFDEIHYMRDRERGVVWEETITLLSNKVRFVFLSATIPNAMEFAEWICHIKNQVL